MSINKIKEFSKAIPLLEKLESRGFEAYFVGGCVRDFLLGRKVHDIDITTSATPDEIKNVFSKVIPIGVEHGTVIVRRHKLSYEVTTFRNKLNEQEDSFTFGTRLEDDLLYRDFTMNALAMDRFGKLIDLFDGQYAIENQLIQAVENPYLRFAEDPLRMVRAFRFASQLGFSLETNTLKAIEHLNENLKTVAVERLKEEMNKFITGTYFRRMLPLIIQSNVLGQLPVFHEHNIYISLLKKAQHHFHSFAHMIALLNCFHSDVGISEWIRLWKGSNQEKKEAKMLVQAVTLYEESQITPWLIYQLDESLDKPFKQIIDTIYEESVSEEKMQQIRQSLSIQSRQDIRVNGHILMKWFSHRRPGQWIEQMLKEIEKAIVMDELNNNEQQIKEWILCHPLAID